MSTPEPMPDNGDPSKVHGAEQMWADASSRLDKIIAYGTTQLPDIYHLAKGNTDTSVVYDWWKAYIQTAEQEGARVAESLGMKKNPAHDMTILMCAAAITRLMRNDDRMRADTVLAQYEKEIHEP